MQTLNAQATQTPKQHALSMLLDVVKLLGDEAGPILRAAVTVLHAPPPAPTPAPVAPRISFPEPADFQREITIGTIAGEPVIGYQAWDFVDGSTNRFTVSVDLAGIHLTCDGENLEVGSYAIGDGMPLRDVAALAELWQSGAVQQLAALSARWLEAAD